MNKPEGGRVVPPPKAKSMDVSRTGKARLINTTRSASAGVEIYQPTTAKGGALSDRKGHGHIFA